MREDISLASRCTFGLGGPARWFLEVRDEASLAAAIEWAARAKVRTFVLGGGSNVVIDDAGFDGLVIAPALRGIVHRAVNDGVVVTASAGESWDDFVAHAVTNEWAGLECLSGIPGWVGATPIQNVGAYGQDVSESIVSVRVFDPTSGLARDVSAAECEFAYRDSAFKRAGHPLQRMIVTSVSFALRPGGAPKLAYAELSRALAGSTATLAHVRDTVIALRRAKSMVVDSNDPNHRSAGSFFTNVIVPRAEFESLCTRAIAARIVERGDEVPRFDNGPDAVKVPSAWLIERAGFRKGERHGAFGISTKHALALVHHGGGRTADLLAFADAIRARVREVFGVTLAMEPVLVR